MLQGLPWLPARRHVRYGAPSVPALPPALCALLTAARASLCGGCRYDIAYQYAISLGEFEGGELCVESAADEVSVVTTRRRAAKVDGRYPHWVAPWSGERYSVIVYKTRGQPIALGPAVYAF